MNDRDHQPSRRSHRAPGRTAGERDVREVEAIRAAIRGELLRPPADRPRRRARLLAALGSLDEAVYPPG